MPGPLIGETVHSQMLKVTSPADVSSFVANCTQNILPQYIGSVSAATKSAVITSMTGGKLAATVVTGCLVISLGVGAAAALLLGQMPGESESANVQVQPSIADITFTGTEVEDNLNPKEAHAVPLTNCILGLILCYNTM